MRVKLERIKNGVALRTSEVIGEAGEMPEVGKRFMMTGQPLDPTVGDTRLVVTSTVVAIVGQDEPVGDPTTVTFQTENSMYRVTQLASLPGTDLA